MREEGFYWCKWQGYWDIFYWNPFERYWDKICSEFQFYDSDFDEIDERRIVRPEEGQ